MPASRSASGASGGSPRALAERRVRTPELAFPDASCDTSDISRRLKGASDRTSCWLRALTVDEIPSDGYFGRPLGPRNVRAFSKEKRIYELLAIRKRIELGNNSTGEIIVRESVLKLSPRKFLATSHAASLRARRRLHTARNGVKLREDEAKTTTRKLILSGH